jgi:hypothetical protein
MDRYFIGEKIKNRMQNFEYWLLKKREETMKKNIVLVGFDWSAVQESLL